MAAIEYEIRIWDEDGAPLVERDQLQPARDRPLRPVPRRAGPGARGPRRRALRRAHRGRSGAARAEPRARRGLAAADDAAMLKFGVKQVAASMGLRASFLAKTVPGEEGSSGHVHLSCWKGDTNAFAGADRAAELTPPFSLGRRRRPRPPAGGLAPAEPDHQLVQAPGPRVVRADQRDLGVREPVVRRARDPIGAPGAVAVRVPQARRRREPVPRARRDRRLGRGRDRGRDDAAPADRRRRVRAATSPSCRARSSRRCGRSRTTRPCARRSARTSATTTPPRGRGS